MLHLGNLECDEGWFFRAVRPNSSLLIHIADLVVKGNASSLSNKNPTNKRRRLVMLAFLIEHPTEGLILYETGAGSDYPEVVGPQVNDVFSRVDYDRSMDLDAQIALTGHNIKDIKMVIIGHLHLDHAGGLDPFRNTGIPIYAHELELKYAFYAVATKSDLGVYLPHYLTFDINWVPFHGSYYEIAPGLALHHSPGHTPGLAILQVNMPKSGTWIFTSDQYHVKENFENDVPQGWLARDHDAWVRSHQMIKGLKRRTGAKVVLGHCWDVIRDLGLEFAPKVYE